MWEWIRLIFDREKTGVYELDEEEMEGMIGEAMEEVEWQDSGKV